MLGRLEEVADQDCEVIVSEAHSYMSKDVPRFASIWIKFRSFYSFQEGSHVGLGNLRVG